MTQAFLREFADGPAVRGFLHEPTGATRGALALTHGAGGNCQSPLLVAVADTLALNGVAVLRCDLPFRQKRPRGSPYRQDAAADREGLRRAVEALKDLNFQPLFLGGLSYGGRQASMLAAEDSSLAQGLLLLSYPLHPPGKHADLRTAHFPSLRTPALFVHGTRDGFGAPEEMEVALRLIPAPAKLILVQGAGHDLGFSRKKDPELPGRIAAEFRAFLMRD
jgi:hypothetical protein